jgi:hypothetical protein
MRAKKVAKMEEIVFPQRHTVLFERDMIEFPAVVDGRTIMCRITLEEMIREFERGSPETFEDDFLNLRPQIEERARERIRSKGASSE